MTDALRDTLKKLREGNLVPQCPYCGAGVPQSNASDQNTWLCGTDIVEKSGEPRYELWRGTQCYERQLAAQAAEIERLKALIDVVYDDIVNYVSVDEIDEPHPLRATLGRVEAALGGEK